MNSDQLRSEIQSLLQQDNQQEQLQVSSSTFNSPNISTLLNTYYAGNDIVMQNVVIVPAAEESAQIVVNGTSQFLNVENASVRATFQAAQDGIDLTLQYQLPTTWKFSQSFPTLPASLDFRTPLEAPQNSYLDLLTLTNASFVVSTIAYIDPQLHVQIEQGLNFISHLKLNGILGGMEKALPAAPDLILSGPIILPSRNQPVVQPLLPSQLPLRNSAPRPGINLKAEIDTNLSFGKMELKDVYVRLYSPLTTDWLNNNPTYEPGMFFGGNLQIGTQLSLEILSQKILGNDTTLVFTGVFDGLALPGLSAVADLVGADDLLTILTPQDPAPAFFSDKGALSIEAASLTITTDPFSIDAVYLTVGLKDMVWQAMEGLISVSNLAARFQIDNPFNSQRTFEMMLFGQIGIDDVPLAIVASAPEFTLQAELAETATLPLTTLMQTYLPEVPAVSDLTVDQMYFEAAPGNSFSLMATLADKPQPWVIPLGVTPLTVSAVQLLMSYSKGVGASATIGGTLTFAGVDLTIVYQVPGSFVLAGQLPPISLKTLITSMCGTVTGWPTAFDITLSNAHVRIEKQLAEYMFVLGTQVDNFGSLALQVSRANGSWAFAAGIDLQEQWKLSSISPALALFDSSFTFNRMLLLLSTIQAPAFTFPDLASFNDPTITSTKITIPASAGGIMQGCNIFAEMAFGGNKGLDLTKKMLHLDQSTLDIVLQIGENPANSMLSANIVGQFNETLTFRGALRVLLQTDEVALSLLGSVGVTVQKHPLLFTGEIDITENGAFLAATMQGSWVDAFTIPGLTISDLALELGVDWEGVPTVGLAGTLTIQGKNGSAAIVVNSITPTQSLLAGSISDLTLTDVYSAFIGQAIPLPAELAPVLDQMALKGIPLFTIAATLASDLDTATVTPAIAQAFTQQGQITLGASLLLIVGKAGSQWYLTDRSNLKHYTIAQQRGQLQVSLEVQLAIVPDRTMIGQQVYQGIRLEAALQCLGLDASARVEADSSNGIMLDGTMSSMEVKDLFRLSGHAGQGDPVVSLATYDIPTSPYRGPHCVISGAATLLECTEDIDLKATKDGILFSLAATIFNVFQASIMAQCPLEHFATAQFSVAATMNNDLFAYLKAHGTAAIVQAASAANDQLTQAQNKVNDFQTQVNTQNSQIAVQTNTIRAERAHAQQALQKAQADVNSIQSTINANQNAINSLQSDIDNLKAEAAANWFNPSISVPNGFQITAKGTEIAGHEAAIVSEQVSLATANATLNVSKQAIVTTPIEIDPRVSSHIVELHTATLGLQGANAVLAGLKSSIGRMADTASWITQHGSDQLLIINHAAFAGQLSQVSGGSVTMSLDLSLMSKPYNFNLDFNFHDLDATVNRFVAQLKQRL